MPAAWTAGAFKTRGTSFMTSRKKTPGTGGGVALTPARGRLAGWMVTVPTSSLTSSGMTRPASSAILQERVRVSPFRPATGVQTIFDEK